MPREWSWGIAIAVACTIGALCAEPYARIAAPYYAVVDRLIAAAHPWVIEQVVVAPNAGRHGSVLQLRGEVRRGRDDARPAAIVESHVEVGEAIETPMVFWTLVAMWPAANIRQRSLRLAMGVPFFLGLEAITTAVQLVHSMAQASAMLAGDDNPLTGWERWSRFLEAGGQYALAVAGALLTVATTSAPQSINRKAETQRVGTAV